ncbi:hypothetical protein LTR94_026576, partial [Friedmanniomyces endolithicus]
HLAFIAGDHGLEDFLQQIEGAGDIGVDHSPPLGDVLIQKRATQPAPGIGAQQVDLPALCRGEQPVDPLDGRQVRLHPAHLGAELAEIGGGGIDQRLVRHDQNVVAVPRRQRRQLEPDAGRGAAVHAGFQDDLGHLVLLIVEQAIALRPSAERHPVRDEEGGVDLPLEDRGQQRGQIALHMGLPGLERQALFHEGAERELIDDAAPDRGHRDAPALAAGDDGLADQVDAVGTEEQRGLDLVDDVVDEEAMRF